MSSSDDAWKPPEGDARYLAELSNPDREPARGGLWIEERWNEQTETNDVFMVMKVRRHGAIVLRVGADAGGNLEFKGLSTFTEDEIRWEQPWEK